MILGVGIDLCDVGRMRERLAAADDDFISAVFTSAEIAYCRSRHDPAQHFAARFAAKEAAVKALASAQGQGSFWLDIEVYHAEGGGPRLRFRGRFAELAAGLGMETAQISLSHVPDLAIGCVILEGPAD